jgi:hypothetical protein
MKDYSASENLQQMQNQADANRDGFTKKGYVTPRLVEYGSFTKLTAGARFGADDGGGQSVCL